MNECHAIDHLITAFVDNEISESDRALVVAHLASCRVCRAEVEAESAARHLLRSHATIARTMGAAPSWRPLAFRLGRPAVPIPRPSVLAALLVAAVLAGGLALRPRTVEAIGVIGDSFCAGTHLHPSNDADARGCVLNCVKRGARFVLVSGSRIYRIENQGFPDLAAFANARVSVTGTIDSNAIKLSRLSAADRGVDF